MAQTSTIEWTDTTWNPVVGCTKVSPGCVNCYAERMGKRLAAISVSISARGGNPGRLANYANVMTPRGRWNSGVYMDEGALADPAGWRKPRRVFVNSMSDLFHKRVTDAFIGRVFAVMAAHPRHTFQVLTKRPERAAALSATLPWSPNIWMGTSVESQDVVPRVGHLRQTGSKVRFLSVEPLIAPVNDLPLDGIHWVIVGGESGPGARPMDPQWVLTLRDACVAAGVPFFFKQWGGVNKKHTGRELEGQTWDEMPVEADQTAGVTVAAR